MSPFLFVLFAEGLSTLIRNAEVGNRIHGVKIGRRVSPISHLFSLMIACYLSEPQRKRLKMFLRYFLSMKLHPDRN